MPRPLGNSNSAHNSENDDGGNVVEEAGLTRKQIEEANYLNSIVVDTEPSDYFAKRSSLRAAYQDICRGSGVDREDDPQLIENLRKSLDDVDRSYKEVGAGGKELAADADTLLSMAKTLMDQMQSFRNANAERVVTPESFANALIRLMSSHTQCISPCGGEDNPLLLEDTEIDGTASQPNETPSCSGQSKAACAPPKISLDQWAWFGRQNYGTLTYDVSFNYQSLRAVVSNDHEVASSAISRKERVKRKKDIQDDAVVLTTKQSESVDDEVSVAQELDKLRKALKKAWKENPSVDYYSFVLDRSDFGKTVENMFYISFLLKDGLVRMSLGDTGLPVLQHVSNEERRRLQVDNKLAAVTNQAIIPFGYDTWQEMVEMMNQNDPKTTNLADQKESKTTNQA